MRAEIFMVVAIWGYEVLLSGRYFPTFRRNFLPSSYEWPKDEDSMTRCVSSQKAVIHKAITCQLLNEGS
jgi:hypothetical protein